MRFFFDKKSLNGFDFDNYHGWEHASRPYVTYRPNSFAYINQVKSNIELQDALEKFIQSEIKKKEKMVKSNSTKFIILAVVFALVIGKKLICS